MTYDELLLVLNSIFTTPLGFLYIIMLTSQWRFSKKVTRWILISFSCFIIVLDLVLFALLDIEYQTQLTIMILNTLLSLGILFIVSKYNQGQLIFNLFTSCDFLYVICSLDYIIPADNKALLIFLKFICYIVVLLIIKYFLHNMFLAATQWIAAGWHYAALIPISLYVTFFLIEKNVGAALISISLSFTVFCIYLSFFHVFRIYNEQARIKEDNALLYAQMHAVEKHADTLQSVFEDVRVFRHDTRHYFHMISQFLENGDYENAKIVIRSITKKTDDIFAKQKIHIYTGRPVIDATLSFYNSRASQSGISIHIEMELWDNLSIDFVEFGVVLSNSLENAFNACCKIPPDKKREIFVTGSHNRQQYFFQIKNTYCGKIMFDKKHMPVTNQDNHGYGTQSIIAFVQKYNGILNYDTQDGWFILQILL